MYTQSDHERARYEARVRGEMDYRSDMRESERRGEQRGEQRGEERGEQRSLVGRVHFCEDLLSQPRTPAERLVALSLDDLRAYADRLETDVRNRNSSPPAS